VHGKEKCFYFFILQKKYPKFWLLIHILILFSLLFSLAGILSCEKEKGVGYKSRTNSPPVISSITILPEKPNKLP